MSIYKIYITYIPSCITIIKVISLITRGNKGIFISYVEVISTISTILEGNSLIDTESEIQVVYNSTQLANLLYLKEPTVRKYCTMLQEAGYTFTVNPAGVRMFFEKDVEVFRKIIELKNTPGVKLEQAIRAVVSDEGEIAPPDNIKETEIMIQTALEKQLNSFQTNIIKTLEEKYKEQNKAIIDELQKTQQELLQQQKYIDEKLTQRDEMLMASIRETLERKKRKGIISALKNIFG